MLSLTATLSVEHTLLTSDPKLPVFDLFVLKVFSQFLSGAWLGCQISAVFVLEIDICFKNCNKLQ
jgi:hypothetical protein